MCHPYKGICGGSQEDGAVEPDSLFPWLYSPLARCKRTGLKEYKLNYGKGDKVGIISCFFFFLIEILFAVL